MPNTVSLNANYPDITRSLELLAKAKEIMHPVSQTLAKGPGQWSRGMAPVYLERGKGSHVWDVDGNEYIDYNMGIGPISLGYCYERVDNAIREQLEKGITFSLMHRLEYEAAALVQQTVPHAESVRISKTGCDVTSAAVRLARAHTGRNKIVCCGYHGWHDWYIATTLRNAGIPEAVRELTKTFSYNNLDSLRAVLDDDVACVILEPYVFEAPQENFLQEVARLTRKNGSLLVFDEMWSGFRVAAGGAQEYFGVQADLACFSKAVANGMPVSFLTGRKDVISRGEHDVFIFTTFGGEALSLAATIATISEIKEKNVPAHLAKQGRKLKDGYNALAARFQMQDFTSCGGFDCRGIVNFTDKGGDPLVLKTLMQQEMLKRGVLWAGFHNMSFSHSDADIDYTLRAYEDALPVLKAAIESGNPAAYLRGEVLEMVFRKTKY
ncbi:MAG: aminotransferase class III-fold pyridoxal phosphate-dependent enzyme [Saprospiraceae bacterium]|jgi:glutamate-1-semialdehyde 2,1-aminomutase|nr:aminotransferase class III-fold pyridoxal phosphate-dependent enzyme [Saprospiraceae bacterium]